MRLQARIGWGVVAPGCVGENTCALRRNAVRGYVAEGSQQSRETVKGAC